MHLFRKGVRFFKGHLFQLIRVLTGLGMVVVVVMVLLLVADVTLRRIFNSPLPWSMEVVKVMLVIEVAFAVSYCAVEGGHISIDLVTSRFPANAQKVLYSIIDFLSMVLFGTMAWGSYTYGMYLWDVHRITGILPIPIAPFIFAIAFGSLLLALVLLVNLVSRLISREGE